MPQSDTIVKKNANPGSTACKRIRNLFRPLSLRGLLLFCYGEFHIGGRALADTRKGVLAVAKANILIDAQTHDPALIGQVLRLRVNLAGTLPKPGKISRSFSTRS